MSSAIYAGSFDPWSIGHEAVLKAALEVFKEVHVLVAVNPSKLGSLDPLTRARIIASSADPCTNWWTAEPPFHVGESIIVATTPGLVVDYAGSHGIRHLVRGLRSTTDFEAEFNLYFSNKTIDPRIQTWAVLCPPELLHCSSTYVRSVVGNPSAKKVGTSFVAQSAMLGAPIALGRIFDLILFASIHRFEALQQDLEISHIRMALQGLYTTLIRSEDKMKTWMKNESGLGLDEFMSGHRRTILQARELHEYPAEIVDGLWVKLATGFTSKNQLSQEVKKTLQILATFSGTLGRNQRPLFEIANAERMVQEGN